MIYMFLSNNPSSGDINSSNLPCFIQLFGLCTDTWYAMSQSLVKLMEIGSSLGRG